MVKLVISQSNETLAPSTNSIHFKGKHVASLP